MSHSTLQSIVFLLQWVVPLLLFVALVTLGILLVRFRSPNRKQHVFRFVIALAALCVCILSLSWTVPQEYVAWRELQRAKKYAQSSFVHVGDPVPSFLVTDTEGADFSPNALRGKVLLINFFATWCGPCKLELPHLKEMNSEFQGEPNFESIVIGRGETLEAVREFRSVNKTEMRMAADPDETVFLKFASNTIPRTIVVSPEGTIVYSKAGFYLRDIAVIRSSILTHL